MMDRSHSMTQEKQAKHHKGRALLAFVFITLGGPIVMGLGMSALLFYQAERWSWAVFFMLPFFALWFGLPASATVGLCAAISMLRSGKIHLMALLCGLLLVAAGAALLLGSPQSPTIFDRYGLWYTLLAAIATAMIAWPAKKLCERKPLQTEGH